MLVERVWVSPRSGGFSVRCLWSTRAGALASWMILTGNEDAFGPIVETIHQLVDDIVPKEVNSSGLVTSFSEETLCLVLMAMGMLLLVLDIEISGITTYSRTHRAHRMLESSLKSI